MGHYWMEVMTKESLTLLKKKKKNGYYLHSSNQLKKKKQRNENDKNKNHSNGSDLSTQGLENKLCIPKYVPPQS